MHLKARVRHQASMPGATKVARAQKEVISRRDLCTRPTCRCCTDVLRGLPVAQQSWATIPPLSRTQAPSRPPGSAAAMPACGVAALAPSWHSPASHLSFNLDCSNDSACNSIMQQLRQTFVCVIPQDVGLTCTGWSSANSCSGPGAGRTMLLCTSQISPCAYSWNISALACR
jgi:hypothetical protein